MQIYRQYLALLGSFINEPITLQVKHDDIHKINKFKSQI